MPVAIEVPQNEDDGLEPKERKYLLSREMRGWAAALAVLVVAVAAVAPTVDYGNLTGEVNARQPLNQKGLDAVEDIKCIDEDQTGGMGGQSVGCTFVCEGPLGTLSVSVDADDADAQVSGTASCASGNAHCSGQNNCWGEDPYSGSGTGTCSANSDEMWDSGLYVECSASAEEAGPGSGPGSQTCPVTDPVKVCIQPVCQELSTATAIARCNTVWDGLLDKVAQKVRSLGYLVEDDLLVGLQCDGFRCIPFEVQLA